MHLHRICKSVSKVLIIVGIRYNNVNQECSDGNMSDLKKVYFLYFYSVGMTSLKSLINESKLALLVLLQENGFTYDYASPLGSCNSDH